MPLCSLTESKLPASGIHSLGALQSRQNADGVTNPSVIHSLLSSTLLPQTPNPHDWRRPTVISHPLLQMPSQQGFLQQLQEDGGYGLLQGQNAQIDSHMTSYPTPTSAAALSVTQLQAAAQNLPDFAGYIDTTKQLPIAAVSSAAAVPDAFKPKFYHMKIVISLNRTKKIK